MGTSATSWAGLFMSVSTYLWGPFPGHCFELKVLENVDMLWDQVGGLRGGRFPGFCRGLFRTRPSGIR
ncbi:MAG TPA: hypothetical protein EYP57_03955 [Thermodesulfobacteriaceae bacterium]|nr:hypothetical protein [Thermodesulfobacteriaceae bacterium]